MAESKINSTRDVSKIPPVGFDGILKAYPIKERIKSLPFWMAVILSSAISAIAWVYTSKSSYEQLNLLVQKVNSIFPNLLGFSLGGYALIVGFGNSKLLKKLAKPMGENETSILQDLSGIFAFSIILQALALCFSFMISVVMDLDIKYPHFLTPVFPAYPAINGFLFWTVIFFSIYSILLLPYVVANVFTFSQLNNFELTTGEQPDEDSHDK